MDFDLTEEQRLLRDSVERLLADHYGFDKRRGYLAEPDGWSVHCGRNTPSSGCSASLSPKIMADSAAAQSR